VEKPKIDKKQLVEELKTQWRTLWRDLIHDKVRAEGIANRDYSLLLVERGTVITASRDYKPLDFYEILKQHGVRNADNVVPPNPSVGGWGRFIRSVLRKQRFIRRERPAPPKLSRKKALQQRKGGRGWLHIRMKW
jgi:hypothetical protein